NKQDLKKFAKEKGIDISDSELDSAYAYVNGGSVGADGKLDTEQLGQVSGGKTSKVYSNDEVFVNRYGQVIVNKKK
ncbi:MAG: hypothetical protein LBH37_02995, partial [Oscillospiraceae bacterium]|nr:hypothetical protein [Oscillospiraceae bacterium]